MTGERSDLMTDIPRAVGDYWERRGAPVLLSALGSFLPEQSKFELRTIKKTLLTYIHEHLQSEVRTLLIPGKAHAVVPLSASSELSDAELVRRYYAQSVDRSPSVNPRFFPEVWSALSRPLQDARRFLKLREGFRPQLVEIGPSEEPEEGLVEVLPADIAEKEEGTLSNGALIADAIRRWADKNKVELSRLLIPTRDEPAPQPRRATQTGSLDALVASLNLLQPHELARISIPADVVLSLLQRLAAHR
jgi:hypothetical protein